MLNDNDDADFVKLVQRKATCGILISDHCVCIIRYCFYLSIRRFVVAFQCVIFIETDFNPGLKMRSEAFTNICIE